MRMVVVGKVGVRERNADGRAVLMLAPNGTSPPDRAPRGVAYLGTFAVYPRHQRPPSVLVLDAHYGIRRGGTCGRASERRDHYRRCVASSGHTLAYTARLCGCAPPGKSEKVEVQMAKLLVRGGEGPTSGWPTCRASF